jgi:DNA-binding transcriptional LysR family regulator
MSNLAPALAQAALLSVQRLKEPPRRAEMRTAVVHGLGQLVSNSEYPFGQSPKITNILRLRLTHLLQSRKNIGSLWINFRLLLGRSEAVVGHRYRRFEWDDLRFFLGVCRHKTVSAAGQQLGVDHATVSRRIARLEHALNTKLFEHRQTGFLPTEAGARLQHMAEVVEASINACEAELSDADSAVEGVVRVGAPDCFAACFLGARLAAFCKAHPKLHVDLLTSTTPSSVSQREVDLFVGSSLPIEGRIISRKLTDYHAGLFASQSYLEGRPPIGSVSDVLSDGYICDVGDLYSYQGEFAPVGRAQFRSAHVLPLLQAVKGGEAIAVLPSYVAQDEALVRVLPMQINFRRSLYVLMHEDNKNLTRVRIVSDFIFNEVHKNRSIFFSEAAFNGSESAAITGEPTVVSPAY